MKCSRSKTMTFSLGVVLAELTAGADAQSACPDLSSFRYWMEEYVTRCQPTANSTCDWVTCDCLQVALQVPVELSDVPVCFQEGVQSPAYLTEEQRNITSELIRGSACGARTRELGQPCGQCDASRMERPECTNTTAPPYRIFLPAAAMAASSLWLPMLAVFLSLFS
mmetsp:Transcript_68681/g.151246  ORF Transcript_68681/g.151246 Transcript_68681/m.151246 type:complete len:167 (+) Transcript_68681:117-617(+)